MAIIAMNSAATGLRALSTQLDVISNNIANANNDGFKASRVNFEDLLYQYDQQPGAKNEEGDVRPTGVAIGYGTRISGTQLDMTQGSATQTGRPLDVLIQGDGFFQLKTPNQGDGLAYTRTGKFFVNPDGNLVLDSNQGYKLDPPIVIPNNATNLTIGNDGRVSVTESGSTSPTDIGQIQLARFVNPQGLVQLGGNLYQRSDASGPPTTGNPASSDISATLQQGSVETSNVDPVRELVDLIKTQRTFELNSQSIQAADQMLQQIGNLRH